MLPKHCLQGDSKIRDCMFLFLPSPEKRVLHLGPFVCLFVCLFVSVCLSIQNFHVFLCNCSLDWDEIFTIGATTRVECFQWSLWCYRSCGVAAILEKRKNFGPLHLWNHTKEKRKNFGPLHLWNHTKEKFEAWHIASTPHGECDFFYDVIGALVMTS